MVDLVVVRSDWLFLLDFQINMKKVDPLKLSSDLIKIKSVTPDAGEAIDLIITNLEPMGFKCEKLIFGEGEEKVETLSTAAMNSCLSTISSLVLFSGITLS